jgi:hypothetical protein
MARKWRYGLVAISIFSLVIGAFVLGVNRGRSVTAGFTADVLAQLQADLALNHLQDYRELEADLSHGCTEEALAKVREHVDTQESVLASLLMDRSRAVGAILDRREPGLALQLRDFKSKYANGWKVPKCTK